MALFDNEQEFIGASPYLDSKFGAQTNLLETISGGAVATVADFGVSVYNSLPGTEEIYTEDILSRFSKNATNVFLEHQDTIETLSFVGGAFIPGTLALKGMNALRAGAKGVSWFSDVGKVTNLAKVEAAFKQGAAGTNAYRQARRTIFRNGVLNNTVDAAATEALVVFSLNAHPILEDYWEEPVKNFGIGLAVGGILGAGGGLIADKFKLNRIASKIETRSLKAVTEDLRTSSDKALPLVGRIQAVDSNIKTLQNLTSADSVADPFTKEQATIFLQEELRKRKTLFTESASASIKNLDPKDFDDVQNLLASDLRFNGADSVDLLSIKNPDALKAGSLKGSLTEGIVEEVDEIANAVEDVVYIKEFDKFASKAEAAPFLRANSIEGFKSAIKNVDTRKVGLVPDVDSALSLANSSVSSASIDAKYLKALKEVDSFNFSTGKTFTVAPDDIFTLNAIVAKAAKDPSIFDNVSFTATKNQPTHEVFTSNTLKANKVGKNHLKQLQEAATVDSAFNLSGNTSSLTPQAKDLLQGWLAGGIHGKRVFRDSIEAGLRSDSFGPVARLGREIAESKESVALRKHLVDNKIADAEGFVYLHRGIKGKAVGHSAVESYTPSQAVGSQFGDTKLFKVHVDDIIGTVTSEINEFEYLVGSVARPAVAEVPTGSVKQAIQSFTNKEVHRWGIEDVTKALASTKQDAINHLLNQGVAIEAIAIRTNTPLDTLTAYAVSLRQGESLSELLEATPNLKGSTYNDVAEIGNYLADGNRPLIVKANANKASFSKFASTLDQNLGLNATVEYMDSLGTTTGSTIYRDFHSMFFGSELAPGGMKPAIQMLKAQVSELNNSTLGNTFIQSSDFFLRNTTVGPIVSLIGKNIQTVATKATTRITAPIVSKMAVVAKNPIDLIEANTAIAVNASLSGHRTFKNGQFINKVTENGQVVEKIAQFNGKDYTVKSPAVRSMMEEMQKAGRELHALKTTANEVVGRGPLNDIGFWIPSFNPKGKFISYVWDTDNNTTQMLWAKSADELKEVEAVYEASIPASKLKSVEVVNKDQQQLYNDLSHRQDALTMQIANVEKFKTGSASPAIIKSNTDVFSELVGGYENYVESNVKNLAGMAMHDVLDTLGSISKFNTSAVDNQPLNTVQKLLASPRDTARTVQNFVVGNNNLNANPFWKQANDNFETYTNWGLNKIGEVFDASLAPFGGFIKKGVVNEEAIKKLDYEQVALELEKQGIANPWQAFDDAAAKVFGLASVQDSSNTTKRAIYAANSFAATFALRVLETAQPLVNAMSLPILTSLAKAQSHPEKFLGVKLATTNVSTPQIMMEGARLNNSTVGVKLAKAWEEQGYFDSFVSEANSVLRESRKFDKGSIAAVENALDSSIIKVLSKPSDMTEAYLRRQTMFTGAALAKRMYPELDDVGTTIFARDFMDRAMGNYHAPQRPVFFQGTAGVGMGLFQTYMLTMGQSVYRHLELKNYKALGKASLLQAGIFGAGSMPGFDLVSQAIGDNFSDENFDLLTGTFRALDNDVANTLIYGIPSSLGPALHTRGDLAPRAVNPLSGGQAFASVNMIAQTVGFFGNVAKAATEQDVSVARSIGQAVSLQSVSRPLARVAELFTGYSVTGQGNTIAAPEDVRSFVGIASRLLSTRPLEETKAREMLHLNTVYGQIDSEHKRNATRKLKTAIRSGNLTSETLANVADDYLRHGGTSRGWQAAVNKAVAETTGNMNEQTANKIRPDSPLMHMIDSLDGE